MSQTGDPTAGWGLFAIGATDAGGDVATPTHPNCPCFGDQPVIGADANGFYISTNEYSLDPFGTFFNGAQIYALSKRGLAAAATNPATDLPAMVHLEAGNLGMSFPPVDDIPAAVASVQPASTPPGAPYARDVEYFLSSFDVNVNKSDQRIASGRCRTPTRSTPHHCVIRNGRALRAEAWSGVERPRLRIGAGRSCGGDGQTVSSSSARRAASSA